MEYILGHKVNINRYKKIEIILCILSDQHKLKLNINNNRNNRKLTNSWKQNNSLLNEEWIKTKIKKHIKNFLELSKNETQYTHIYGM